MKRLSDYSGDEAIELWGDLLEPLGNILSDDEIRKVFKSGQPKILIAKAILKCHKEDAEKILLRIDDTPIDGVNVLIRLLTIVADIVDNEELKGFFAYAEKMGSESIGSPMVSTEAEEN